MNNDAIRRHLESQSKNANTGVTFADLMQLNDAAAAPQAPQDGATAAGQGSGQAPASNAPQGAAQGQGGAS